MLTQKQYAAERAIVDAAETYAREIMRGGKRTFLTPDEAANPLYAACDNAMRGRVEQYDVLTTCPDRVFAYVSFETYDGAPRVGDPKRGDRAKVRVWTGLDIGEGLVENVWRAGRGDRRAALRITIAGARYVGIAPFTAGDYCRLRRVKS